MTVRIDIVAPTRDLLGECPLWDTRAGALYWIDGRGQHVRRMVPATGVVDGWPVPAHIGSIALCESGDRLLLALEDGFALLDTHSGAIVPWAAPVRHAAERMRLNDGRCDRDGRFVVGSMTMGRMAPEGAFYGLAPDGSLRTLASGIHLANATCFSPDGRWLYFADSHDRRVRRHAYDRATGIAGPGETLIDTAPYGSAPDGATVDAEGYLWVALVLTGRLARFAPDGRLDRVIEMPVTYVTCPCFGGADLDVIYVTSISNSGNLLRSDDPDAGAVFAIHGTGVRGLAESRFDDRLIPQTERLS
jgi:sugar lactone lactonase YvrE